MKKYLLILIGILICILPINASAKENNVTIYLFRGSTCSHCEEALEYISKHKDRIPENVEFVTYEVWDNQNNGNLRDKVSEKLGVPEKYKYSVPFFVVGNKYIHGYAGVNTYDEIIGYAKDYLNDSKDDYKDVVKEILRDTKISASAKTLDDLYPEPNSTVTIVVLSVFGVIILGFAAMIIFSRK